MTIAGQCGPEVEPRTSFTPIQYSAHWAAASALPSVNANRCSDFVTVPASVSKFYLEDKTGVAGALGWCFWAAGRPYSWGLLPSPPPSCFFSLLSLQFAFLRPQALETSQIPWLGGNELLWVESSSHAHLNLPKEGFRADQHSGVTTYLLPIAGSHWGGVGKVSRGPLQGGGLHLIFENSKPEPLLPTVKQERLSGLAFTFPFWKFVSFLHSLWDPVVTLWSFTRFDTLEIQTSSGGTISRKSFITYVPPHWDIWVLPKLVLSV